MQILWATQSDPGQSVCDRSANKIFRRGGDTARATRFRVFVGQCWPLMLHCLGFIFLDNSASEGWAETGASSSSPLQHGLCLKFQTACLCDVHWLYYIFHMKPRDLYCEVHASGLNSGRKDHHPWRLPMPLGLIWYFLWFWWFVGFDPVLTLLYCATKADPVFRFIGLPWNYDPVLLVSEEFL